MQTFYTAGTFTVVKDTMSHYYYIKDTEGYIKAPKMPYVSEHLLTYLDPMQAVIACKHLANS